MANAFTTPITYFLQEGLDNLTETLRIAFSAAKLHSISRIVIFTARGEGIRLGIQQFGSQEEYKHIKLVGVTFPQGKTFTDENDKPLNVSIPAENLSLFREHRVRIVRAHLPFDPIATTFKERGVLAQDLSLIGDALGMFGGSMSLCVQAATMACDAGAIGLHEHVISMTSDTAILVHATSTARMLKEFVIREVLCKPAVLSIRRKETAEMVVSGLEAGGEVKRLPETADATGRHSE